MQTRSSNNDDSTSTAASQQPHTTTAGNSKEPNRIPTHSGTDDDNSNTREAFTEIQLNYWDGNLPHPQGTIAQFVAANFSVREQQNLAQLAYEKIYDSSWDAGDFQADTRPFTFLVALPGKKRGVRLMYGLGTADDAEIFPDSTIRTYTLALHGEHHPHQQPDVMTLDLALLAKEDYKAIDCVTMDTARLNTTDTFRRKSHFGSATNAQDTVTLPQAVPFPAYLMYDGFDKEIDAVVLYERALQALSERECYCRPALDQVLEFLRATVTSTNKDQRSIVMKPSRFIHKVPAEAYKWRHLRVDAMFPDISALEEPRPNTPPRPQPSAQAPTAATTATPVTPARSEAPSTIMSPPTGHVTVGAADLFRLFQQFQTQANNGSSTAPVANISSDSSTAANTSEDNSSTLGLDELVYNKLLLQCGLTVSERDDIPSLWSHLKRKGLSKTDKEDIIREALSTNLRYRGRKIPLLPSVLSIFKDRSFGGDYTSPSLILAAKGISPFSFPSLTEAQIEQHIEHGRALDDASTTTVGDVSKNKLKARAPDSFVGLINQLQTFVNALQCGFGELCPLMLAVDNVILSLEEFSDTERQTYNKKTFASILWIIMLQSREFARGHMKSPTDILPSFQQLVNNLTTRVPIAHGGVPTDLYATSSPTPGGGGQNGGGGKKREQDNGDNEGEQIKKRRTKLGDTLRPYESDRTDIMHSSMRKEMAVFNQFDKRPKVKQLCVAAGISATQLFPDRPNLCIRAQLFGRCDKKCKLEHQKASDGEISAAIQLLGPAFTAPKKVYNQKV